MLFSRLPRPGQLIEIVILVAIGVWVFQNPHDAGHLVGDVFHFVTGKLPAAFGAFVQGIGH